jgi:hypothetical protein
MSNSAEPYIWTCVDAPYLREQAQRCVRLAHELEVMGNELMEKAAELDQLEDVRNAGRSAPERG